MGSFDGHGQWDGKQLVDGEQGEWLVLMVCKEMWLSSEQRAGRVSISEKPFSSLTPALPWLRAVQGTPLARGDWLIGLGWALVESAGHAEAGHANWGPRGEVRVPQEGQELATG